MAGSLWIWNGNRWLMPDGGTNAQRRSEGKGSSSGVPMSGDAGFVMSDTCGDGDFLDSGVLRSGTARKSSERPLLPSGFWLLRGAGRLTGATRSSDQSLRHPADSEGEGEMLPQRLQQRLIEAGLFVWTAALPLSELREYAVPVFHLEALAVERIYRQLQVLAVSGSTKSGQEPVPEQSWRQWPAESPDPQVRRAAKTAVRALYTLGLDYGEVRVVLDGQGRAAVRTILPLPARRLAAGPGKEALQRFAAGYGSARGGGPAAELRIGADPEFVLLRADGRIVSPARFLDPHSAVGCDTVVIGRRVRHPVAELRPSPATDPAVLAGQLRRLLRHAASRITEPGLRWLAGGMPVPGLGLGGHIHFSGAWLSTRLLRMLDSCVAFPLALVEDPAGRKRRPRYGALGDYRLQPHGFEYRTPPSWLISPMAAQAAFALGLLAVRELWPLAAACRTLPAERTELVSAYYAGDRDALYQGMRGFLGQMAATPSYRELKRYIAPLLHAIDSGATWDEQQDLRHKWKLPAEAMK
ncbi:putative amidoligase domain-containing protein [Paenibacillus sp. 1P07SE]|uniref:putative amidoligase domain-containing protein n=1 Tax=Paenibacillus sp. 1P07SE TaxID=3132209 RepID=UPI0039A5238E